MMLVKTTSVLFVFFVAAINCAPLRTNSRATQGFDDERLSASRQRMGELGSKINDIFVAQPSLQTGCSNILTTCTNHMECANMCGERGPGRCLPDVGRNPKVSICFEDKVDEVFKDETAEELKRWLEN